MNVLSGVGQYAHGKILRSVEVTSNYLTPGSIIKYCHLYVSRVFIRHWRSEKSPFTTLNSPADVQYLMAYFYPDVGLFQNFLL